MRSGSSSFVREDDFEGILVAELEALRKGERHLKRLYPRLQTKPQLREQFLNQLAEVKQRADRLNAVLSPLSVCEAMPSHSTNHRPAA